MITIELDDKKYNVPEEWVDVTIEKFIELNNIDPELDEITKNIQILSILSGISEDELLDLPVSEYVKLKECVSFIGGQIQDKIVDSWEHNGIEYKFDSQIGKYSTGMFLDLDELSKEKIDNLPMLMAIMYRPLDKNGKIVKYRSEEVEDRSKIFSKYMPVSMAINSQLFFTTLVINSMPVTGVSLTQ